MNNNQEHIPSIEEHTRRRKDELLSAQQKINFAFASIASRAHDVQSSMTDVAFEAIAKQNQDLQTAMATVVQEATHPAPGTTVKPWVNQEEVNTARSSIEEAYETIPAQAQNTSKHNSPSAVTSSDANDEVARLTNLAKQIQRDNDIISQELLK